MKTRRRASVVATDRNRGVAIVRLPTSFEGFANMAKRVKIVSGGGSYFAAPKTNLKFIYSGCKTLDLALGGGWAEDRVINIVGDKATGKTLLCIEGCANFVLSRPKGRIRYREAESAFDKPYARTIGMPTDRVDFGDVQLTTVEDMFEDLTAIIKGARTPELVVVDSLDSLSSRAEMDRDIDEGSYGGEKAKKMSEMFRRLVRDMHDRHVTLIIISQIRDKIGATFGRKFQRTGGRALDFYASQVVMLAHLGQLAATTRGIKVATGVKVKAKVDKNKVGLPFRESLFNIRFGYGIDDAQACVDWLTTIKGLKQTGITPEQSKFYLRKLLDMPRDEADAKLNLLRDCVQREWYEIEESMLPSRGKYA